MHLTQIVNNKIHKVDLCESCAQQKGVTDPEAFSLADLLSKSPMSPVSSEAQAVCPSCGCETADFRKTGRFGCSDCYEVFKDLVLPVLEEMHTGTSHQGKVPTIAMQRQSSQLQLKSLQDALANAIESEAYEEAAKFRDQIKLIKEAEQLEVSNA